MFVDGMFSQMLIFFYSHHPKQSSFTIFSFFFRLVLVRLRSEEGVGKNLSYSMVEIMWQDIEERIKLLDVGIIYDCTNFFCFISF